MSLSRLRCLLPFILVVGSVARLAAGHHPDRLIVVPREDVAATEIEAFHLREAVDVRQRHPRLRDLSVVQCAPDRGLEVTIAAYEASGLFAIVEPDYLVRLDTAPNDPKFASGALWHLSNWGQSSGTSDADIDGPEAWALNTGAPSVIVAVIDSGVRLTHEDLVANLWTNPGEIAGNGIDDDGNGYVDDVHGINAIDGTGAVVDDNGHGTHVAGIIAARGNNGLGVTGVAWEAQIMALRFSDENGEGYISDALRCFDYALRAGATVINCSWSSTEKSRSLEQTLRQARQADIVVAVAAGNDAARLSSSPCYPAAFTFSNLIKVAATTRRDALASYSNYDSSLVDVGAPGSEIVSCWNTGDSAYATLSGTSMATPVVAGIAAHLRYVMPDATAPEIVAWIKATADPLSALSGKVASGGRINLQTALGATGYFVPITLQWEAATAGASSGLLRSANAVPALSYLIESSRDLETWTEEGVVEADASGVLEWPVVFETGAIFLRASPTFEAQ